MIPGIKLPVLATLALLFYSCASTAPFAEGTPGSENGIASLESAEADSNSIALEELASVRRITPELSKKELKRSIAVIGKWMDHYNLRRYGGEDMTGYFFSCLWHSPEYSMFDFVSTLKGMQKTVPELNKELVGLEMIREVPEIRVPTCIIIGVYDLLMNSSRAYFDTLKAEKKYWMPVENAGLWSGVSNSRRLTACYIT